jgi:hypothetical protein
VKEGTEIVCIPSHVPDKTWEEVFSPTVAEHIVHHGKDYPVVVLPDICEEDLALSLWGSSVAIYG